MNDLMNKIMYIIRKNSFVKAVLKKPFRLVKKCRKYTKSKTEYNRLNETLNRADSHKKKIFYFCAAIHPNLGDLAQRLCIKHWLVDNYQDYEVIEIPSICFLWFKTKTLISLEKMVRKADLFVFQSGYTMSDLHPDDEVRKCILHRYRDNPCLIFPQTVLYKNPVKLNQIRMVLEQQKSLFLLARDKISYNNVSEYLPRLKTELFPDIVTTLIGTLDFSKGNRAGIGLCIRNDGEKYYSYREINALIAKLKAHGNIEITDTNCDSLIDVSYESIEKVIVNKIQSFAKYKVIITDRYHGTIFSLIAGTPVIVIKTNDHKVSSGVNWFIGIYDEYAKYCDSLEEVPSMVEKIISTQLTHQLKPYFKEEYYDKLKSKFVLT